MLLIGDILFSVMRYSSAGEGICYICPSMAGQSDLTKHLGLFQAKPVTSDRSSNNPSYCTVEQSSSMMFGQLFLLENENTHQLQKGFCNSHADCFFSSDVK